MKFKAALFYHGSIAFYSVYFLQEGLCKAKLDEYTGHTTPPALVELKKDMIGWTSDCHDPEVVRELGAAIEQQFTA